jgi:hypothetical protein
MLSNIYNNKGIRRSLVMLPSWLLLGAIGLSMGGQAISSGASLFVFSQKNSYAAGHIFSVDIVLSTKDPVNVVDMTLVYPPDMLEVIDVNRQDSLLSLWIQDPEHKASPGTMHFSGGVAHRLGFAGEGKLATVLFRSKKEGVARVDIVGAQVLASDGMGTDILGVARGGVYIFTEDGGVEFDLDGNGVVNMKDLALFVEYWGNEYDIQYDFNRNDKIDLNDLTLLVLVLVRGGGV